MIFLWDYLTFEESRLAVYTGYQQETVSAFPWSASSPAGYGFDLNNTQMLLALSSIIQTCMPVLILTNTSANPVPKADCLCGWVCFLEWQDSLWNNRMLCMNYSHRQRKWNVVVGCVCMRVYFQMKRLYSPWPGSNV